MFLLHYFLQSLVFTLALAYNLMSKIDPIKNEEDF